MVLLTVACQQGHAILWRGAPEAHSIQRGQ